MYALTCRVFAFSFRYESDHQAGVQELGCIVFLTSSERLPTTKRFCARSTHGAAIASTRVVRTSDSDEILATVLSTVGSAVKILSVCLAS